MRYRSIYNLRENFNVEWENDIDSETMSYESAIKYVKSLGSGWRLPSVSELQNLVYTNKSMLDGFNIVWTSELSGTLIKCFVPSNGTVEMVTEYNDASVIACRSVNDKFEVKAMSALRSHLKTNYKFSPIELENAEVLISSLINQIEQSTITKAQVEKILEYAHRVLSI